MSQVRTYPLLLAIPIRSANIISQSMDSYHDDIFDQLYLLEVILAHALIACVSLQTLYAACCGLLTWVKVLAVGFATRSLRQWQLCAIWTEYFLGKRAYVSNLVAFSLDQGPSDASFVDMLFRFLMKSMMMESTSCLMDRKY